MILEIDTPKECWECVFCSEMCFCLLMYGELISDRLGDNNRATFCPFDNPGSLAKIAPGVRFIACGARND